MSKSLFKKPLVLLIVFGLLFFIALSLYSFIGRGKSKEFGKVIELTDSQVTLLDRKNEIVTIALDQDIEVLEKGPNAGVLKLDDVVLIEAEIMTDGSLKATHIRITPGDRFNQRLTEKTGKN